MNQKDISKCVFDQNNAKEIHPPKIMLPFYIIASKKIPNNIMFSFYTIVRKQHPPPPQFRHVWGLRAVATEAHGPPRVQVSGGALGTVLFSRTNSTVQFSTINSTVLYSI